MSSAMKFNVNLGNMSAIGISPGRKIRVSSPGNPEHSTVGMFAGFETDRTGSNTVLFFIPDEEGNQGWLKETSPVVIESADRMQASPVIE